nr:hypothetical protein CFP56_54306 [Quercus suber]
MVDYFAIRADSPSIAFFFAHLVSHSAEVARLLRMFEVRSRNLETGLSSSDDCVVLGATSVSTPYKAWNVSCSLSEKDKKWIRERFQFPNSVKIRILSDKERSSQSYADEILVSCMVVWMSAHDGDVIMRDEFLHFYHLRKSKDPGYYEFKPWDRASRLILNYLSSLRNWKPNFFFVSRSGWVFVLSEDLDDAPKFFYSWGVPLSVAQHPHLKKRYQCHTEKVKDYLESIKDFDKLVSPQSLFLNFLVPGMTTRFSKQKLAEDQEKKAKGGTISRLLSKKKTGDVLKKDFVMLIPPAHSPAKRPTSPTSFLEMITFGREETRKKKKAGGKSFLPTLWDDADVAALKAHEAFSVDDLSPLMAKSSSEVMSSHIQKLVQALGESLFVSRKLLDLEEKVATSEPLVKSLFAKNEALKSKVAILTTEAKNDKECVSTLEKSL